MLDVSDYELQRDDALPPSEPHARLRWILIVLVLLAVTGAAVWYFFPARRETPTQSATAGDKAAPPPAVRPLGGAAASIELPPLAETDALVRQLVGALSSNATIAAWLATDGLIRSFTIAVDNIARGVSPAPRFRALRPAGRFAVIDRDEALAVDPRSYERYTPLAVAVDSLDPDGVARLYTTLKPRIQEAYEELGQTESFDGALERAIVSMLQTPPLDGPVQVVQKGAVMYAFENPRLERLTPAQKQLARMGPRNTRMIQARLRQIAAALGIPATRLP
jgi:DUF3014 family protein